VTGFVSLVLFGLVLSAPLVAAVFFEPARRAIDWIAGLTGRMPAVAGAVFIALGLWSVWFGLYVTVPVDA
jgi:cytochrome c-type biogenesis protein